MFYIYNNIKKSKYNIKFLKKWFLRYLVIVIGFTISSIGINGFLKPAHLLSGGVSGIAIAINYITNINTGILIFIINIPIFIVGFKFLDKEFCYTSVINVILFSIIVGFTQNIGDFINVNDLFIQSIYGGLLNGIGLGLIFKVKSSSGGFDIIGAILKSKKNIPIKSTSMIINIFIVIISSSLFEPILVMYTLISIFVSSNTMSTIKDLFNSQKSILLISDKYNEIAKDIMEISKRGVTFIEAQGAYTNEPKKIIYCLVDSKQIPIIKKIVLKHDKNAFLSINVVEDIKGKGFKEKTL